MNNKINRIFIAKGLTAVSASRISGIPYVTILQHLKGTRGVSPHVALLYEKHLGIPRSEIRPDLWPDSTNAPEKAEASHA